MLRQVRPNFKESKPAETQVAHVASCLLFHYPWGRGEKRTKRLAEKHETLPWEIINKLEKHISERIYEHPSTLQTERISVISC